ncbi:hypothetical protein [uncultured Sphingomonas sp.]|uniref:hypothetical protein n=1 Tax=uncultured Sphingomonas sp. TaxID=158754 RepID=UPI0030F91579
MKTDQIRLRDILDAGHPDSAIVGVPIGTLKALVAGQPAAAELVATPYVGTLLGAAA